MTPRVLWRGHWEGPPQNRRPGRLTFHFDLSCKRLFSSYYNEYLWFSVDLIKYQIQQGIPRNDPVFMRIWSSYLFGFCIGEPHSPISSIFQGHWTPPILRILEILERKNRKGGITKVGGSSGVRFIPNFNAVFSWCCWEFSLWGVHLGKFALPRKAFKMIVKERPLAGSI